MYNIFCVFPIYIYSNHLVHVMQMLLVTLLMLVGPPIRDQVQETLISILPTKGMSYFLLFLQVINVAILIDCFILL